MKTLAYATALTALTVVGAHAQTAYEVRSTTTTETVGDVTTQTTTEYVSTSVPLMPKADGVIIGEEAATPEIEATGSVRVKLANGDVVSVADSTDEPWTKAAQLKGYDRFTFDPVNNMFIAGKGETQFDSNWDDSGNRVRKAAPAPRKKVAAPAAQEEAPMAETPTAETSPAVSEPAAETTTPATDMDVPPAE
ncbi:MAG: hypothetical protein EON60_08980 [Alphaproteobacteria bacterium]|nr:MAG: hypothetical protein EON60_08980 [Alphaproteobacteria bacterium]